MCKDSDFFLKGAKKWRKFRHFLFRGRPTGYCLVDEALHKTPYPLPLSGHVEFVDHAIVERLLTCHPIVAIRILTNLSHRLTRMVG